MSSVHVERALREPKAPWILWMLCGRVAAYQRVRELNEGRFVDGRVVRGSRMRTRAAAIDEMSGILQFAEPMLNWNAFLDNFAILPSSASGHGLVVVDPEQVLCEESPEELEILVDFWYSASRDLSTEDSRGTWLDHPAIALHLVLCVDPLQGGCETARWEAAGANLGEVRTALSG